MLLGGSAYAAATITGKKIKNSSITGRDVKNKSLTRRDFKGSVRGRRGAPGPAGLTGPPGPSAVGQITVVKSAQEPFGTDVVRAAVAFCPTGSRVVSGGGISISDQEIAATEATDDRAAWFVIGIDETDNGGEYVQAQALCAPAGLAIAATSKSRVRAQVAKLEAKIKAERR
jgi:hypothetical protein